MDRVAMTWWAAILCRAHALFLEGQHTDLHDVRIDGVGNHIHQCWTCIDVVGFVVDAGGVCMPSCARCDRLCTQKRGLIGGNSAAHYYYVWEML